MNIVVYCASSNDLPQEYTDLAIRVGRIIGNAGACLVYGGVDAGLMHSTAFAAKEAGAKIIGVVPARFKHRADVLVDELVLCDDLNDRKGMMIDRGDVFVVLPGGIGTLDELFSTLSIMKVSGDTHRKIIIANIDGVFNGIVCQLDDTQNSQFTTGTGFGSCYLVADSLEQTLNLLTKTISEYDKE